MKPISILSTLWMATLLLAESLPAQVLPGRTQGHFRQDPSGTAHYTIPLDLPPGTNGMAPQVALSYSSQGGNGILGVGWQLSAGQSAIARVGQKFELDGNRGPVTWTVDNPATPEREGDRFTLDGQYLVLASGTYGGDGSTYRTRMESWQKVSCINQNPNLPGPETFTVQERSGRRRTYGLYQPHRITVDGPNSAASQWLLTQVTDPDGNLIYYDYAHCDAGETGGTDLCNSGEGVENRLRYITYTANAADPDMPLRLVEFVYEDRPDVWTSYQAGYAFKQTKRLKRIITYVDDEGDNGNWTVTNDWQTLFADDIVRIYELEYEQSPITGLSRLVSVQESDGEGHAFPPTRFSWTGTSDQQGFSLDNGSIASFPPFSQVKNWANRVHKGKYNEGTHLIDLNGDGLKDIIQGKWQGDQGANSRPQVIRRIILNRGSHWEELSKHPYLNDWAAVGTDVDNDPLNGIQGDGALFAGRGYFTGSTPGFSLGTRMVDINADGLPDMLQLLDSWKAHPSHDDDPCNCNGGCCSQGDLEYPSWGVRLLINEGEAGGWKVVQAGDPEYGWIAGLPVNGDGVPLLAFDEVWRAISNIGPTDFLSASGGVQLRDVNGDGLPDLVQAAFRNGDNKRVFINRGPDNPGWERNTIYESSFAQLPAQVGFFFEDAAIKKQGDIGTRMQDLNGDGLPDVIALNQERNSWYTYPEVVGVWLNRGNEGGFVLDWDYTNSLKNSAGDGRLHFTQVRSDKTDQLGTRLIDVNRDGLPDLLSLLKNGNQSVRKLMLNTGKSFVEVAWNLPPAEVFFNFYQGGSTYDGGTRWADLNQDGYPELLNFIQSNNGDAGPSRKMVYVGAPGGWALDQDLIQGLPGVADSRCYFTGVGAAPFNVYDLGTRLDDINGDGRLDFVQLVEVDQVGNFKNFYTANNGNGPGGQTSVDKLRTVTDGIGSELELRYLPMTDTLVYRKGNSSSYPTMDVVSTGQVLYESVVRQSLDQDGIRNDLINPESQTTRYHYAENRIKFDSQDPNELGAGALGFREVQVLDLSRNVATETVYIQDGFPFSRQVKYTRQRSLDNGWRLSVLDPTHRQASYTLPGGKTYLVSLRKNLYRTYEGNVLAKEVETDYQSFDAFGNALRTYSRPDGLYTHRWYHNDTSNGKWVVGLAFRKAISEDQSRSNTQAFLKLKSEAFDIGAATSKWHLLRDTSWVRNANGLWRPILKSFTYDTFGNVRSTTTSPDQGSRLYTTEYGYDPLFHTFLTYQKNPLGHLLRSRYDPGNGNLLWEADGSGRYQHYRYDGLGRRTAVYVETPPGILTSSGPFGLSNSTGSTGTSTGNPSLGSSSNGSFGTPAEELTNDSLTGVNVHYQQSAILTSDPMIVPNQAKVSLVSGTRIRLRPGFHAQAGSSFRARVAGMQLIREVEYNWSDPANQKGFHTQIKTLQDNWESPSANDYAVHHVWMDAWGRSYLEVREANGQRDIHLRTQFSPEGLVAKITRPYFLGDPMYWTETTFDDKDRPLEIRMPGEVAGSSEVITYTYGQASYQGQAHAFIDKVGKRAANSSHGFHSRTLINHRDQIACRVFYQSSGSDTLFFDYDRLGRSTAVTGQENAMGQRTRTRSVLDALDRKVALVEEVLNGAQVVTSHQFDYEFDDLHRLMQETNPLGQVMSTTYDALGRPLEWTFPYDHPQLDDELVRVDYAYDAGGAFSQGHLHRVRGFSDAGKKLFQYDYTYDPYGNVSSEQLQVEGLGEIPRSEIDYLPTGAKREIVFPDGDTTFLSYNQHGQLEHLEMATDQGLVSADFSDFYADGNPGRVLLGNGVEARYAYQAMNGRLDSLEIARGATQLNWKHYQWNDHGLLDGIQDLRTAQESQSFLYDELLRLSEAQSPMYATRNYQMDAAGNLTSKGDLVMEQFQGNRLLQMRHGNGQRTSYQYDDLGNRIFQSRNANPVLSKTFAYDPLGKMVYFQDQSGLENRYLYDHQGRRLLKEEGDGARTYYVSPGYEVRVENGQVFRTKYLVSPSGKLAQITSN